MHLCKNIHLETPLTKSSFVFHKDCMLFERRARYGMLHLQWDPPLIPQQQAHHYNRLYLYVVLRVSVVEIPTG